MAYNMSFKKGKYPGEPGYAEWTGFEKEMKIPGTLSEKYKPIEPNTFLKKLISNKTLSIKPGQCFSDYSIRNQIEMEKNKKYFQPKKWCANKLLYNYYMLYHAVNNKLEEQDSLNKLIKKHLDWLYSRYKVVDNHRINWDKIFYKKAYHNE